jgi:pimeloyl-ACP methyl ester carboxylesterase
MRKFLATLACSTACLAPLVKAAAAEAVPRAVIADPARDAKYPATNRQAVILSHGDGMNALFLLAAGSGPKPTMLLLHGLPGNEQNLDLAQAARRAGWNVLTMHYRGSWGSPGAFTLAGAAEDVDAAMNFLLAPQNAGRYRIDPRRIVIAGHSMGGFFAARYAARHDDVIGALLIDPWNIGATGKAVIAKPETRQDAVAELGEDFGNSLPGTDAGRLMTEVERHAQDWDLVGDAPGLAAKPVLIVSAEYGLGSQAAPLAAAIKARGGKQVRAQTLPTDHNFADHRIALAASAVNWLNGLSARAAAHK